MGRSSTSCFKIITCAGGDESVDPDDVHSSSENKGSDKRGWSFRKRSARHRVLSNTVVTEAPSSEKKENSDPVTTISSVPQVKFNISEKNDISEPVTSISSVPQVISNVSEKKDISEPISSASVVPQVTSNISEKTSDNIWIEEPPRLSNSVTKDTTVSTIATDTCEDDIKCDPELVTDESESGSVYESAILVIQAAVRKFLAQRQMVKYKNVVKLQAAVRGHLVRSHAVGTLRCVQAIVKMQALVRARRGYLSAERSSVGEKGVQNPTHISMEKLLSNSLARQLLESTPKTKQINIKCDPLKSDSAWNWLERWMSVSTPETIESHAPEQEQDKVETVIPSNCESTKMISDVKEATVPCEENEENLISIEENSHLRHDEEEKPQPANTLVVEPVGKPDTPPDEPMELNAEPQIEAVPNSEKPVSEPEPKCSAKRLAADQPDSEGRKSMFGRKASNPAFIAAQSRFEELTSRSNSLKSPTSSSSQEDDVSSDLLKSVNSSKQDDAVSSEPSKSSNKLASEPLEPLSSVDQVTEVGSSVDIGSSAPEKATTLTAVEPEECVVSDSPKVVPNGGSECGTELSITSTLDSPDQSEVEIKKFEEEDKVLDEKIVDPHGHDNIDIIMPEKHDSRDDAEPETENTKPANNADVSQVEQKLDDSVIEPEPKPKIEPEHEMVPQVSEGSPRSHITVPESQGTPSSQVSTNTKKSRSEKKVSSQSQKRKSWSSSKNSSVDSALRSSLDQLPKDPKPEKTEKRRNSFGSPRPDHSDHQPSVPSYMQATESARAKAIANSSPRSSPDVHDKDLKKRHSLPGAVNGRQGSPRIQRSMSQALQTTKASGNQEKKWQR